MDLKICRVCLDQSGSISVFDRDGKMQYSAKIMRCANVTITETDDLPKEICGTCLGELTLCYQFVEKCEAADRTLRALTDQSLYDVSQEVDTLVKVEQDAVHNFDTYFSDTNECIGATSENANSIIKDINNSDNHIDIRDKTEATIKKCKLKKRRKHKQTYGRIQCVICGLMPSSASALEVHMRTHTGESPYSCQFCNRQFKTKGSLKRHTTTNHLKRERRFTCETCGNSFYTKSDIITHMRIHTNEKPYECSYCFKTFRQIASLIRHKRTHTGERPFSCHICGRTFSDKTLVKKHQLVHTNEKKYSCHLCGQSVKTKTALNTHLSLHTNEKSNICSYCNMAFAAKGNLQNHIRRLHSEKSGQCSICLKTFKDLEEHMHKHTGEKPFNCANCNEAFASKRSLGRHMLFRHQNAGKFRCSIRECSKTFPVAMMLEFHLLKQHTNHKPYICPHCARGFYRTSDLSRHMRVSHGDAQRQMELSNMDIKISMKSVVNE